jgi:ribosomal protein S18 acetylase RimI-like enzyme
MRCSPTSSLESFLCSCENSTLGRIEIRPLVSEDDVLPVCSTLVRAFASELTLNGASSYVREALLPNGLDKGVMLVAKLYPLDSTCLPPNQSSRIIAAVTLSFHPDTMQKCSSLPPPSSSTYLANMAVDIKFRRQGVARSLLQSAVEFTQRVKGETRDIFLHVKQGDEGTISLYEGFGFREVAREEGGLFKKASALRILMKLDTSPRH